MSSLTPYARNARRHSKRQIRQIAESIKTFGFTNPIIIDRHDNVIAGHGRLAAAQGLGFSDVPVIRIEEMSPEQVRAYRIADNRLAELAGWDRELLALEFQGLLDMDLGFDLTVTGFEMGEIDVLIEERVGTPQDADDVVPAVDTNSPPVTQRGDLWACGEHRLICGDALQPDTYSRLMGSARAQLVFADPPYNVRISGHVSGKGRASHPEFAMASGEMSPAEFTSFLKTACRNLADFSVDGSIHFLCIDWRHFYELLTAGQLIYSELKNLCVWTKTNGGMGSLYRSQHELIAVFKRGKAPHINNVELGRYGRNRTNVWAYTGMNAFHADREEVLSMHPTPKPVALVHDAILDCSNRGGIVLDSFVGSGTTLIAAERAGRRAVGVEIDPLYVDVALRRFRDATGVEPIHIESGRSFGELEAKVNLRADKPKSQRRRGASDVR